MTTTPDIQIRVQRLVAGRASVRDLERIFIWLRFRALGFQTVKDVGDFAGHLEDRNQGASYESIQRWYDMFMYVMPKVEAHGTGKRPPCNKETLAKGASAVLQMMSAKDVKRGTGMRKDRALRALDRGLAKIAYYDGTNLRLEEAFSRAEEKALDTATQALVFAPAFTDSDLANDLAKCLLFNNLIERRHAPAVAAQKHFIALFAIEKMHLARVKVTPTTTITLSAGITDAMTDRTLAVSAYLPIPWEAKEVHAGSLLFQTSCSVDECCSPELLQDGAWNSPVEMGQDGKLHPAL